MGRLWISRWGKAGKEGGGWWCSRRRRRQEKPLRRWMAVPLIFSRLLSLSGCISWFPFAHNSLEPNHPDTQSYWFQPLPAEQDRLQAECGKFQEADAWKQLDHWLKDVWNLDATRIYELPQTASMWKREHLRSKWWCLIYHICTRYNANKWNQALKV